MCVCVRCVLGVAPQNEMNCKPASLTAQSWAQCPGHVGPMLAVWCPSRLCWCSTGTRDLGSFRERKGGWTKSKNYHVFWQKQGKAEIWFFFFFLWTKLSIWSCSTQVGWREKMGVESLIQGAWIILEATLSKFIQTGYTGQLCLRLAVLFLKSCVEWNAPWTKIYETDSVALWLVPLMWRVLIKQAFNRPGSRCGKLIIHLFM